MLREGILGGRRSQGFTLQWHLTSACGMACTHCYQTGAPSSVRREDGERVLDDLAAFCARRDIPGQVCFTGGDPLLHPEFLALYRSAARRGLSLSILGNPAPRAAVEEIVAALRPRSWQVSLEGLEARHDAVRGPGSFARTWRFLELLRELGVRSHAMLTLTAENAGDLIELARRLRGKVDRFAYSRLARTGRGSALRPVGREEYARLAEDWVEEAVSDPGLTLKDGLLNVALRRAGRPLAGGCTGAGCGAAFNFVALLPDGEVHACRKVPSLLGHAPRQSLEGIWSSAEARRWRAGSRGCAGCALRRSCGGCPAVTHGEGLDPLVARDPHCTLGAA